jgi:hypothetical protein
MRRDTTDVEREFFRISGAVALRLLSHLIGLMRPSGAARARQFGARGDSVSLEEVVA